MPYLYIKSCELNDMLFLQTTIIPNKGNHNFQHSTLYSRFFYKIPKAKRSAQRPQHYRLRYQFCADDGAKRADGIVLPYYSSKVWENHYKRLVTRRRL